MSHSATYGNFERLNFELYVVKRHRSLRIVQVHIFVLSVFLMPLAHVLHDLLNVELASERLVLWRWVANTFQQLNAKLHFVFELSQDSRLSVLV